MEHIAQTSLHPTTVVVNLYKEPYDVYIGRAGHGLDGYFGNPEPLAHESDREQNLKRYKRYLWERARTDITFRKRLMGLAGKRLGCFCKPKACHGDVIVAFIEWDQSQRHPAGCGCDPCYDALMNTTDADCPPYPLAVDDTTLQVCGDIIGRENDLR